MKVVVAFLFLAVCGTVAAADDAGRIRVLGRAQEARSPDFAAVSIGAVSRGLTPAAALDAASKATNGIIASAKSLQVADADIASSSVTLEPTMRDVRQPDGTIRQQPDGYTASLVVEVRLEHLPRLGELMRTALDSGANRIEGLSFGLRDQAGAEAAVQAAAFSDAKAQAERLAMAAGVRLGVPLTIDSPSRADRPPPVPYAARAMAAAPRGGRPVPIAAGSIVVSAEVDAVFAIER